MFSAAFENESFRDELYEFVYQAFKKKHRVMFYLFLFFLILRTYILFFEDPNYPLDCIIRNIYFVGMEYTFVHVQPNSIWAFHFYNLLSFYSTGVFSFEQMIEMEPSLKQVGVALMVSQFMYHNISISLFSFTMKSCVFSSMFVYYYARLKMAGLELCGGTECAFLMWMIILIFSLNFSDNYNYFILDKYEKSERMKRKWFKTLNHLPQGVLVFDQTHDRVEFKSKAL